MRPFFMGRLLSNDCYCIYRLNGQLKFQCRASYERFHRKVIRLQDYGFKWTLAPMMVVSPLVLCIVVPSTILVSEPCTVKL